MKFVSLPTIHAFPELMNHVLVSAGCPRILATECDWKDVVTKEFVLVSDFVRFS